MRVTRRTVLKVALIGAAASRIAGAAAVDAPDSRVSLRIFDSRSPQSRAWLGRDACAALDVAQEQAQRWSGLRSLTPRGRVEGLTAWSDLVQARGVLEQKGKRLRSESRSGQLFHWVMV
jgi:hypothetical protein